MLSSKIDSIEYLFGKSLKIKELFICGLIGAVGNISHELKTRVFKDMLDACASRGRDSTGVIKVKKDLEYTWSKHIGAPAHLYDTRMYEKEIENGDAVALIGHTRSKTIGEVNVKNAHPFDFEDEGICGVHNGTLRGYYSLDTYHHSKVDSEVLYGHLAKNGPEDTFKTVEGAYCCIWWNNKDKTINFIRNNERPLWFTWSDDLKTMFWASEIWMFGSISRKIKLWDGGNTGKVYMELEPHKLHSFRINPTATGDQKTLTLLPVKEIRLEKKFHTPIRNSANGTGYRGINNDWEKQADGTYQRKFEPPVIPRQRQTPQSNGGKVTDPFMVNGIPTLLLDHAQIERIQEDGPSSEISNVAFLRNSLSPSGSSTDQSSTKNSKRNILSLPGSTSKISPIKSKEGRSESCTTYSKGFGRTVKLLTQGVSHRVIAGVPYITWNATKDEFTEHELLVNTGGVCCFCKGSINGVDEVGDFISKTHVLCTFCVTDPVFTSPSLEAC